MWMKSHQVLMEEKIKDVVYIRAGKGEEEGGGRERFRLKSDFSSSTIVAA